MTEKREVCTCTNCGNEAEMIVTCEWVEVEGEAERKQKETRKCTACGNEADMIIDFDQA